MEKLDILSMSLSDLETTLLDMGEKKFRAKQVFEWLHIKRVSDFSLMTNLSSDLRLKLSENFQITELKIVRKLCSKIDGTIKYLYELSDGNHIETVLMDYHHGDSICISTQVGCKMGCKFCASTIAGFKRNLTPSEMLSQIYTAEKDSGRKISSIVMMGIGEPLDNYDNVIKFLNLVSCPEGNNMSLRHLSLSTCGLVNRINDLSEHKFGLTLSISLHAANNKQRSEIMPVNDKYDINELISACKNYIKKTGRRISFEYALINGVNDSRETANELISLLRGMNCHVNIIPVNKIKERNYKTDTSSVRKFQHYLEEGGINATVRRTLGSDINAACGQLRREYEI